MRVYLYTFFVGCILVLGLTVSANGQQNTISGMVFGENRLGLNEMVVELEDTFSRTIDSTRTDNTGKYFFGGMGAGRYKVKVLSSGTVYSNQSQEVIIQNLSFVNASGERVVGSFDNANRDFYLRVDRRKAEMLKTETVFAQEVPKEALNLYKEGVALLADAKSDKQKRKNAQAKLRAAIEIEPTYFMALETLGLDYIEAGFYEAGGILLQNAVKINPKSFKSWYGLGYALYSLGHDKDGLDSVKKALTVYPQSVSGLLLAGRLSRRLAEFQSAEKYFNKAKDFTNSEDPQVFWELALLYGKNLMKYEEAAQSLETLLKLQPKRADAAQLKTLIKDFRTKAKSS